jgi:outer membrane lipoprotein SlyB
MTRFLTLAAAATGAAVLAGCATTDGYASACERDYAENRNRAMAAGALLGGAIGAAVAGDDDREAGAAIGAAAGALIGRQLSAEEDPCGYGFGGYNADGRYGYERVRRYGDYPRYW